MPFANDGDYPDQDLTTVGTEHSLRLGIVTIEVAVDGAGDDPCNGGSFRHITPAEFADAGVLSGAVNVRNHEILLVDVNHGS